MRQDDLLLRAYLAEVLFRLLADASLTPAQWWLFVVRARMLLGRE